MAKPDSDGQSAGRTGGAVRAALPGAISAKKETTALSSLPAGYRAAARGANLLQTAAARVGGALHAANALAASAMSRLNGLSGAAQTAAASLAGALDPAALGLSAQLSGVMAATEALTGQTDTAQAAAAALGTLTDATDAYADSTAAAQKTARRALADFDELHLLPAAAAASATGGGKSDGETKSAKSKNSRSGKTSADAAPLAVLAKLAGAGAKALAPVLRGMAAVQTALGRLWAGFTAGLAPAAAAGAALGDLWKNSLLPLIAYLSASFAPGVANAFSAAFAPIASGALRTGLTVLGGAVSWLAGLVGSAVTNLLQPALALALTVWQGLFSGIANVWAALGQPLLAAVENGFFNLQTLLSTLYNTVVLPIGTNLIALLGSVWTTALQPLWQQVLTLLASIGLAALNLWNAVLAPLLTWLAANVGPVFAAAFNAAAAAVGAAAVNIANGFSVVFAALQGVLDFVNGWFAGGWSAAWSAVQATAANVWARIRALISGEAAGIVSIVNSMVSAVQAAISAVGDGMGGLVRRKVSVLAGVPHLAAGGYVAAGQPTLAMIGDNPAHGEIVAPEDKLAAAVTAGVKSALREISGMLGGGAAGAADTPVNIYLGGELLDTVLLQSKNRVALRSGGRA